MIRLWAACCPWWACRRVSRGLKPLNLLKLSALSLNRWRFAGADSGAGGAVLGWPSKSNVYNVLLQCRIVPGRIWPHGRCLGGCPELCPWAQCTGGFGTCFGCTKKLTPNRRWMAPFRLRERPTGSIRGPWRLGATEAKLVHGPQLSCIQWPESLVVQMTKLPKVTGSCHQFWTGCADVQTRMSLGDAWLHSCFACCGSLNSGGLNFLCLGLPRRLFHGSDLVKAGWEMWPWFWRWMVLLLDCRLIYMDVVHECTWEEHCVTLIETELTALLVRAKLRLWTQMCCSSRASEEAMVLPDSMQDQERNMQSP